MFKSDSDYLTHIVAGLSYGNPNEADAADAPKFFTAFKTVAVPSSFSSTGHMATQNKDHTFQPLLQLDVALVLASEIRA